MEAAPEYDALLEKSAFVARLRASNSALKQENAELVARCSHLQSALGLALTSLREAEYKLHHQGSIWRELNGRVSALSERSPSVFSDNASTTAALPPSLPDTSSILRTISGPKKQVDFSSPLETPPLTTSMLATPHRPPVSRPASARAPSRAAMPSALRPHSARPAMREHNAVSISAATKEEENQRVDEDEAGQVAEDMKESGEDDNAEQPSISAVVDLKVSFDDSRAFGARSGGMSVPVRQPPPVFPPSSFPKTNGPTTAIAHVPKLATHIAAEAQQNKIASKSANSVSYSARSASREGFYSSRSRPQSARSASTATLDESPYNKGGDSAPGMRSKHGTAGGSGRGGDPYSRTRTAYHRDRWLQDTSAKARYSGHHMGLKQKFGRDSGGEITVPSDMSTAPRELTEQVVRDFSRAIDEEDYTFDSLGVYLEIKWMEVVHATASQPMPCFFRTACCCALMDKACSSLGRFTHLVRSLFGELLRAIFHDYERSIAGARTPDYGACTPYFMRLNELEGDHDDMQSLRDRMRIVKAKREAASRFFNRHVDQLMIATRNRVFGQWRAYFLRQKMFERVVVQRYQHSRALRCVTLHFRLFQQGVQYMQRRREHQRELYAESCGVGGGGDALSAHAAWARVCGLIAGDTQVAFTALRKTASRQSKETQTIGGVVVGGADTITDAIGGNNNNTHLHLGNKNSASVSNGEEMDAEEALVLQFTTPAPKSANVANESARAFVQENLEQLGTQVEHLVRTFTTKLNDITSDPEVRTEQVLRLGDEIERCKNKWSAFQALMEEVNAK